MTRHVRGALTIALLIPATASASQRFASPSGTHGGSCTIEQPCDIDTAINSAAANDDIEIEPGTYGSASSPITTTLSDGSKFLTIHGTAGAPKPVIYSSATPWALGLSGGSEVTDLKIVDSAPNVYAIYVISHPAVITRVDAETTGAGSWACYPDGEVIDSLCWASGPNGGGARPLVVNSVSVVAADDTIIGSGPGDYGISVYGAGPTTMAFNVSNTIIHGTAKDVHVQGGADPAGSVIFGADHSNFATVENAGGSGTITVAQPGSGTNQTAAPLFVNAAGGDFHEAAGSPTIDAGMNGAVQGSFDLDHGPRQLGASSDIGAYEFVPPPTCQAATAKTAFQTPAKVQLSCADLVGAAITYASATQPAHGSVAIDSTNGIATYTPNTGYSGPDGFTYVGASSHGQSVAATVSITVGPEPAPIISKFSRSGRRFLFTMNEPATVRLTIRRKHHHARNLARPGIAGTNTITLAHRLERGRYTVTLSATNAGGTAKARPLRFKIKH